MQVGQDLRGPHLSRKAGSQYDWYWLMAIGRPWPIIAKRIGRRWQAAIGFEKWSSISVKSGSFSYVSHGTEVCRFMPNSKNRNLWNKTINWKGRLIGIEVPDFSKELCSSWGPGWVLYDRIGSISRFQSRTASHRRRSRPTEMACFPSRQTFASSARLLRQLFYDPKLRIDDDQCGDESWHAPLYSSKSKLVGHVPR